jgi:uncharacterized protein YndB with AHSA1/START domain
MPNTVRLHRVLAAKPEKVYRAFLEADALAKWLPPNGFACTVHHPRVGGTFKMSFRNFTTGNGHSFKVRRRKGGTYPLSHLYGYFGLVRLCRLGHDVPWAKA